MTLTDAGALVALLDSKDPCHQQCVAALKSLPGGPLLTTWPCFTEGMYLLFRDGGIVAQRSLWKLYQSKNLHLHDLSVQEISRMADLMEKYHDTPMDLADASLVVTAQQLGLKRIFTLDSDFRVYRLADGSALDIVP